MTVALAYLSCAWVAGIFLGWLFLELKLNLPLVFVVSGLLPLPLLLLTHQYKKPIILTSLCLVALFSGAFHLQSSLPPVDESHLQFYNNQGTVEIRGLVDREPEAGDATTRLYLSAREIKVDEGWRRVSGATLLFVPRYPGHRYGDLLLVTGKLERPPWLDNANDKGLAAPHDIASVMHYPEVKVLAVGRGSPLLEWVYSTRNSLARVLAQALPEPQAALAQGLILGIRSNMPPSVTTDFVRTGAAHLLAISGLNLTIVAGILLSLGVWLFGRQHFIYIWLALAAIWLYALLTGMNPPVLRAAIMASLWFTAELLGRQRHAFIALALAAAIMVSVSPAVLWEAAFQMSFMAMAGLIFIFPPLQTLARRAVAAIFSGERATRAANFVAESLGVSLAAVIGVWPLVAHYFGVIAWVSPLATLLALPVLPGILILGAVTGGLGLIFIPAAQATAWLAWLFLSCLLLVVKAFSLIPPLEGRPVNSAFICVYYSAFGLVIWLSGNRKSTMELVSKVGNWLKPGIGKSFNFASRLPMKWVIPGLLVLAILAWLTAATMPDSRLRVSFLDVGQGDAILIQKASQQILVDGGPSPRAIALALGKQMPFWDRTIDLVVLTHPHPDHISGLIEVLNRYRVKQALYPDLDYNSPLYDEWLRLLREKNIKYALAHSGQQIAWGGVAIDVLNPPVTLLTGSRSEIDNNAVVLRVKMGEVSFLLSADIMWETEFELIARRANLRSTVLKVAHHGSTTSTSQEFLAVVDPQVAVISVGKGNPYGHPTDAVLNRLKGRANICRTDKHGTVEFITNGERLWVKKPR